MILYYLLNYFSTTFPFVFSSSLVLVSPKGLAFDSYYFFYLPVTSHQAIVLNITLSECLQDINFQIFPSVIYFPTCMFNCHPIFIMVVAKLTVFYVIPLPLSSVFLLMALMIPWFRIWNLEVNFASNFSFALNTQTTTKSFHFFHDTMSGIYPFPGLFSVIFSFSLYFLILSSPSLRAT